VAEQTAQQKRDHRAIDLAARAYSSLSPETGRAVVDVADGRRTLDDLSRLDLADLEAAGMVERTDGRWRWTEVGEDAASLVRDQGRDQ
jgi:hypothetical protein